MRLSRSEDVRLERLGASLKPGFRVVVPYLGEPDRFSERVLGLLDGDDRCSVSIGGKLNVDHGGIGRCCFV